MAAQKPGARKQPAQPGEGAPLSSPRPYGVGPGDRVANMREILAIKKYQRAIERNPLDAEAHLNLGVLYFAREKGDEAMALFKRALELRPDYPEAHTLLGMEYHYRGMYDEAIAEYQEALRLKPDDPAPYRLLALIYEALGRPEEAQRARQRAEELAGSAMVHSA
jgi:tetratricopeptide (TPR) repeat protein